ncbi:MAG: four helix bundle protein [Candidatus Yanofskybacteria bacterium]|nr:four helix bundle protein [Candidatus Yanofskybacteria bacterium]
MDNNITAYDTPLFQAAYKLYLAWHVRCQLIPKKERFAIGQKTENLLLELMMSIVTAYHTKSPALKRETLFKANSIMECVKIIMRLAKDIKALDQRWYIEYERRLQEMGKMLGGWIRQTQNSPNK